MNQSITQRDAFWNKIFELAKIDKDVIVVSADMGAPSIDQFKKYLSEQFVNVGIAEQNAISLSSGLSLVGKKVFAYAIAPFITLRCLEQIRIANAINKIPITIVGVGAGFGYEDSGPTHHTPDDIAIMRSIPNITINNITDSVMAEAFADISYGRLSDRSNEDTTYIRLERKIYPNIYTKDTDFKIGLSVLKESNDFYIISTGCMVSISLEISEKLQKEKDINIGVIDIYQIPINEKHFIEVINNTNMIITLEEHFLSGGLGSAILEILNDNNIYIPVRRIGLSIEKGYSGSYKYGGRNEIRKYYGIDNENIEKKIINFINK